MQQFPDFVLGQALVQQGKGAVGKPGAFFAGKALGRRPRPGKKQKSKTVLTSKKGHKKAPDVGGVAA